MTGEDQKIKESNKNNSERPVDALAVKKLKKVNHPLTDNFKSRDASASNK